MTGGAKPRHGGKRAGSGRPSRTGTAATKRITVWLTEAEEAAIRSAAAGPVSEWARGVLLRAATTAAPSGVTSNGRR